MNKFYFSSMDLYHFSFFLISNKIPANSFIFPTIIFSLHQNFNNLVLLPQFHFRFRLLSWILYVIFFLFLWFNKIQKERVCWVLVHTDLEEKSSLYNRNYACKLEVIYRSKHEPSYIIFRIIFIYVSKRQITRTVTQKLIKLIKCLLYLNHINCNISTFYTKLVRGTSKSWFRLCFFTAKVACSQFFWRRRCLWTYPGTSLCGLQKTFCRNLMHCWSFLHGTFESEL